MEKIIDKISKIVSDTFKECNYSSKYGVVTLSNRPDLCQYQCNGAMIAAKEFKKAPIIIAEQIVNELKKCNEFKEVDCVKPGFINISLDDKFIVDYIKDMMEAKKYGCKNIGNEKTIVVDYGGPNIAKPLHVGHLRSAIIGETIKRIGKYLGYNMLGDVHLGDWGLQIGLIIAEFKRRNPKWVYFIDDYKGEYPNEAPFTIDELEEIYPTASSFAKLNPEFMEIAKELTYLFQTGHRGYKALWEQILNVSIQDLKKNYSNLNVFFELWKKESDSQEYIPKMIKDMKNNKYAYISEGALVVDVNEDTDKNPVPPCIIVKSDGATLYSTTDLATIIERERLFNPTEIIYIVDKRQELHFEQVFRCARKTNLVSQSTKLTFLGFGTMNGIDGKPFKTRDGGVMKLENLIKEANSKAFEKVIENEKIQGEEATEIAKKVGLAAIKYSDLSNQISKDYIFDIDRFTAKEGNTGPYILYTIARIRSIFNQLNSIEIENSDLIIPINDVERNLMLKITQFNQVIEKCFIDYEPNRLCQFIYELSNEYNSFYHVNKIKPEKDLKRQKSWLYLSKITKKILLTSLELMGIDAPERM